jgi:hypothetical protein
MNVEPPKPQPAAAEATEVPIPAGTELLGRRPNGLPVFCFTSGPFRGRPYTYAAPESRQLVRARRLG